MPLVQVIRFVINDFFTWARTFWAWARRTRAWARRTWRATMGRILCFKISLNPLRFSLTRETDTKMTRSKSWAIWKLQFSSQKMTKTPIFPNYQVPNGYFGISLQVIYDCSSFVSWYFCVSFSRERRKIKAQNPNLWLKTRWKRVSQARIFNMVVEKYLAWVWQGTSSYPNLLQTYVIFNKAARILGWHKSPYSEHKARFDTTRSLRL